MGMGSKAMCIIQVYDYIIANKDRHDLKPHIKWKFNYVQEVNHSQSSIQYYGCNGTLIATDLTYFESLLHIGNSLHVNNMKKLSDVSKFNYNTNLYILLKLSEFS